MKRKEFNELREKTLEELMKIVAEKKADAEMSKMKILGGKKKNLKLTKNLTHEVAKILTLVREKEIVESLENKEEKRKEKPQE